MESTDKVNSEDIVFDTNGIKEALASYRGIESVGSNHEVDEDIIEDEIAIEPSKPSEDDKSFKDNPENQKFAELRRKEKIEELRKEKEKLSLEKEDIEKDFDARVEAKLKEVLEKQGIKSEAKEDENLTKQKELIEKYEETGDIRYYDEYRDLKEKIALENQKQVLEEMISSKLGTLNIDKEVSDMLSNELKELNQTYGTKFETLDDLETDDKYDDIMKFAEQKGVSLSDSYFLAHKNEILEKTKAKAIKEATKHSHIKTSGVASGESDYVELDAQDLALAKGFGMSPKEYAQAIKKFG